MLYFENDYGHGAHPEVLRRLCETNLVPQPGYGADEYSEHARALIRAACGAPDADVFFVSGGTQANALVIGGLLRPWEGVISAVSGHVNTHEAGAVEFTGHKVLPLPHREGKIGAGELSEYLTSFRADPNRGHRVFPGMVYLSHPTEYGTLYTREELAAVAGTCQKFHIPLYLDGARLGCALGAGSGAALSDIARLCDVFCIGGTKCGAVGGEALVFPRGAPEHFTTLLKQRGALLAQGRLVGAQFEALFTDGLYEALGRRAVSLAMALKKGLLARGYRLLVDSPTNQQFPIVSKETLKRLAGVVRYSFWEPYGEDGAVIRLATSWATREEDVEALLRALPACIAGPLPEGQNT